ncbi:ester cyclase [Geodermatophilus sp. URMC 61]|uniref:ester cyclase n=1 Tax=Geodermatophilus sp. URMC 61 TaxID=3423411 RepID=UPI00406D4B47
MGRAVPRLVSRRTDGGVHPRRGGPPGRRTVRCSGTHTGAWLGHPPTGRRFDAIDEVYLFHLHGGRIVEMWGLEGTTERLRQLGLT